MPFSAVFYVTFAVEVNFEIWSTPEEFIKNIQGSNGWSLQIPKTRHAKLNSIAMLHVGTKPFKKPRSQEFVTPIHDSGEGHFICICGNDSRHPMCSSFQPCNKKGKLILPENTKKRYDKWYFRCESCGRYFSPFTTKVIGKVDMEE
jgi:hypothetical protein